MRIGVGRLMQNYADMERSESRSPAPPATSDTQVYAEELALADLAEPLGFDSIWTTDHYFDPYQMTGSALQQATYMAARTSRVDFGTMVITLPWHHPLQIATEICTLDNMLGGRHITLGFGRGSAQREFEAFGIPMSESRGRFLEAVEIIRLALTREWFSFAGQYYQIPETTVRPRPRNPERLVEDMRIAWQSPAALPIGANAGLEILTFGAKTWEEYERDIREFNEIRRARGWEPSRPVVLAWAACTETDDEGRDLIHRHVNEFLESNARHYNWADVDHFKQAEGFEHHAEAASRWNEAKAKGASTGEFPETQIWGTPERCVARLREIQKNLNVREVICLFKYGTLPYETAEKSMRLFAEKVLPEVHSWSREPVRQGAG